MTSTRPSRTSTKLTKRILELSYHHKLSHIGSCLSVLGVLEEIYKDKHPKDKVILSAGHSHLAHLVLKESYGLCDAGVELKHGIHCDRKAGCDVSTGSLGHGLGIALGLALANPNRTIYVITTDGELSEGSCWEVFRLIDELKVNNLEIHVVANYYGAYKRIDPFKLMARLQGYTLNKGAFIHFHIIDLKKVSNGFLEGQSAHYDVIDKPIYELWCTHIGETY